MQLPKQSAPVQRTLAPIVKSSENSGVEPSILGLIELLPMILRAFTGV